MNKYSYKTFDDNLYMNKTLTLESLILTSSYSRRLVSARLVVTDTLLDHFCSNSAHRK